MENKIVTDEKLEKLKSFTIINKFWGIHVPERPITSFACTDYILDQLNPARETNVPFTSVPLQFKDTPLDFFFNLPYDDKKTIDKLNSFFSLIEEKNKFKEKSILAVIPRGNQYNTLNILFSEEWKKDSYRISGILKVVRNWDRLISITKIKDANLLDASLSDFLYIALTGQLDKVNKNCPFTGWSNKALERTVHGYGGIASSRKFTLERAPGFLRKKNMTPLLYKINKEYTTYEMPKL